MIFWGRTYLVSAECRKKHNRMRSERIDARVGTKHEPQLMRGGDLKNQSFSYPSNSYFCHPIVSANASRVISALFCSGLQRPLSPSELGCCSCPGPVLGLLGLS